MKKPQNANFNFSNRSTCYMLIFLLVSLHYISISGIYLKFTNTLLPGGDPFTYTVGFFHLLDMAQKDFWGALSKAFLSNFYWLMNIGTVLFSPVLIKEPFSISIINYAMWTLASISLFRLCTRLKIDYVVSFLSILLIWFFPINFGFLDYSSIPVLGLDSMFMAALQLALFSTVIYALEPTTTKNALIAGFTVGLAIWGRGGSLLVVGMVLFLPVIIVLYKLWKTKSTKLILPFSCFASVSILMMAPFYYLQGKSIFGYYYNHAHFVTRQVWNLHDAMPYFKNIPGFFFWRDENSFTTISLSFLFHIIVCLSFIVANRHKQKSETFFKLFLIASTAVFIYVITYVVNIILFTDPLMNIYNCLLIYAPMRIGISLSLFTLIVTYLKSKDITLKKWIIAPACLLFLWYGVQLTKHNVPKPSADSTSPSKMDAFAKNIELILNGGSLSMLWYHAYSPLILKYYRVKSGLPEIVLYMNKFYNDIWQPYNYTESKRLKVREEVKSHFEEADFIIIPEYEDYFAKYLATSFARMGDEFTKYLNSPQSKKFVVRATIQERDNMRLLLLQRKSEAKGLGEPLKLPYGKSDKATNEDYGVSVIRY